ncbi:MAG TPA: antitoxin Xre/MbcA/ParS toxin-binding domain-containing protein [Kaistia sp.]|nr:antitoxin Xre/MbcA/ParS toxin-binding domain-containing protein [Kaistia sp.]
MTAQHVFDIVGGAAVFGEVDASGALIVAAIRHGLPTDAVDHLVSSGRMSLAEIDAVVLPRKTLSHRRKIGTLTADQSDRLMRTARVIAAAEETFGSQQKAALWLRRPTSALSGEAPLALLDTSEGVLQVEALLAAIDHGIAA